MQVGAMDRELRPVVAGVAAARLLEDELAVAAVEGELARLDALGRQGVGRPSSLSSRIACGRRLMPTPSGRISGAASKTRQEMPA